MVPLLVILLATSGILGPDTALERETGFFPAEQWEFVHFAENCIGNPEVLYPPCSILWWPHFKLESGSGTAHRTID